MQIGAIGHASAIPDAQAMRSGAVRHAMRPERHRASAEALFRVVGIPVAQRKAGDPVTSGSRPTCLTTSLPRRSARLIVRAVN